MAKFLDTTGLTHFWSKIKTLLNGKADSDHTHSNFAGPVTFEDSVTLKNGSNQVAMTVSSGSDQLEVGGSLYTSGNLNVDGEILNGGQRFADLFAEADHNHDDEYATITSLNTVKQQIGNPTQTLEELEAFVVEELGGKADSEHTHDAATTSAAGFMTAAMVTKLNGIATGANKTTVDTALNTSSTNPVQNKVVTASINTLNTFMNTTVPNTYAKKTDIASAYRACGSLSSVPSPSAEDYSVGDVFNITASFTTTSYFVEGAGKQYPAGTNIVIVDVSGTNKWDVLAGFIDTSTFATYGAMSAADQVLQDQIDAIEAVTGAIDSITTTEIDAMMNS